MSHLLHRHNVYHKSGLLVHNDWAQQNYFSERLFHLHGVRNSTLKKKQITNRNFLKIFNHTVHKPLSLSRVGASISLI